MNHPRFSINEDDEAGLPDDLLESIEDTPSDEDDYGDETQSNEERVAEEGLELDDLIDPRGEDEREDDVDA
ncbi:MAG: hypothetical protein ACREPX_10100 [Rhodanobacteraceae bacterium]